ncbi:HAD family hydrolase [Propionibacteriaceae bacterium Y2011]|uniref:HAD family hydrolase n=1 Tax=Microlunatus sp. Y2014 TaxID=3418488 RepID=UPI003B44F6C6
MPAELITEAVQSDEHRGLQAVLWDFDGTLADSEQLWMAAEYELIPSLGGEWNDEHAHALVGNSLLTSAAYIVNVIGRDDIEPAWIVDQLTARVTQQLLTGDIPWRPGALELLAHLADEQIPCALVSASYRSMLDAVLSRLPESSFATVVAGDEVTHGKPHPEPYLTAAATLDVDPARCVVLEDSPPGAASGNAAGAIVLGIRNVVELPTAPLRHLTDTLVGVDAAQLDRLVTADFPPTVDV